MEVIGEVSRKKHTCGEMRTAELAVSRLQTPPVSASSPYRNFNFLTLFHAITATSKYFTTVPFLNFENNVIDSLVVSFYYIYIYILRHQMCILLLRAVNGWFCCVIIFLSARDPHL